jgi:hypothetical protein
VSARKAEANDAPGIDARELCGLFTHTALAEGHGPYRLAARGRDAASRGVGVDSLAHAHHRRAGDYRGRCGLSRLAGGRLAGSAPPAPRPRCGASDARDHRARRGGGARDRGRHRRPERRPQRASHGCEEHARGMAQGPGSRSKQGEGRGERRQLLGQPDRKHPSAWRRGWHKGALVACLLPRPDSAQPLLPAQGRTHHPGVGGATPRRARDGGPDGHPAGASVAARLLLRRDDRGSIQRRGGWWRGARARHPAGRDDRGDHLLRCTTCPISARGLPEHSRCSSR